MSRFSLCLAVRRKIRFIFSQRDRQSDNASAECGPDEWIIQAVCRENFFYFDVKSLGVDNDCRPCRRIRVNIFEVNRRTIEREREREHVYRSRVAVAKSAGITIARARPPVVRVCIKMHKYLIARIQVEDLCEDRANSGATKFGLIKCARCRGRGVDLVKAALIWSVIIKRIPSYRDFICNMHTTVNCG